MQWTGRARPLMVPAMSDKAATAPALKPGDHLFLVDGSNFIFRAYFQSINQDRKYNARSDGLPSGAVRLFATKLFQFVRDGVLVERVGPAERAIVFGLGHVARSLGPLLDNLGFSVIVCDDNETGAADTPPPWATHVIESFDIGEITRVLGGFGHDDYALIITRDHAIDQQLLEALISHDELGYLGMIGSRGKVGRFRKRLEAKGIVDDSDRAVSVSRVPSSCAGSTPNGLTAGSPALSAACNPVTSIPRSFAVRVSTRS